MLIDNAARGVLWVSSLDAPYSAMPILMEMLVFVCIHSVGNVIDTTSIRLILFGSEVGRSGRRRTTLNRHPLSRWSPLVPSHETDVIHLGRLTERVQDTAGYFHDLWPRGISSMALQPKVRIASWDDPKPKWIAGISRKHGLRTAFLARSWPSGVCVHSTLSLGQFGFT